MHESLVFKSTYNWSFSKQRWCIESLGIAKPSSSFDYYVHSSNVKIGKMHIPDQWEEKNLTFGVHLKKDLKRKFWNEQIKPFFGISNSD